eukprot:6349002-Prymnesium_polylepis.1
MALARFVLNEVAAAEPPATESSLRGLKLKVIAKGSDGQLHAAQGRGCRDPAALRTFAVEP